MEQNRVMGTSGQKDAHEKGIDCMQRRQIIGNDRNMSQKLFPIKAIGIVLFFGLTLSISMSCDEEIESLSVTDTGTTSASDTESEPGSEVETDNTEPITLSISDLSTEAKFFTYPSIDNRGTTIRYFAVMGKDEKPHVAFDACDVCWQAGLGYSQIGDNMQCNNCLNQYPIVGIGSKNIGSGCWPGYLEFTTTDTDVVIDPQTLEDGAWYFQID